MKSNTFDNLLGSALVATFVLFSASTQAAPELVTNGGFETGTFAGWTATPASCGSSDCSLFGVDASGPHVGSFSAYFGGLIPYDTISQSIATTANTSYVVSFLLASLDTQGAPAGFVGSLGGTQFIHLTDANPDFPFESFSFVVQATSNNAVLSFGAFNNNDFYTLDNVSVTAVPEPSTYALVALGLAGMGVVRRRKAG